MLSNLFHFGSFRNPRRTSPTRNGQHAAVGNPGSIVSPPESVCVSPIERAGLSEPHHIDTRQGEISSLRFSLDGRYIIVGGKDGMVRRWNVEGNDFVDEAKNPVYDCEGGINSEIVSKDGRWMIGVGSQSRTITVWDARTHKKVAESTEAHEQEITALDVSRDASKVATGSRDGKVFVWCLETGQRLAGPFNLGRSVLSVRFSPTGERLAGTGWHYLIHIWNIFRDDNQFVPLPAQPAFSLAWSNDGRRLFAGCAGGSISSFDVSDSISGTLEQTGQPYADSISTLYLSSNGKFAICASNSESHVKIWDVQGWFEIISLPYTCEALHAVTSPDDGRLAVNSKNGKISVWNLRNDLPTSYFYYSLTARLTFPCRSGGHPVLTDISNAAYIFWRKAELTRAEEILSNEIEHSSSSLHYPLANRALVRARLKQWGRALDDAQVSLGVKSSLVALLAKGLAQIGQKLPNAATETLDVALEHYDQAEKGFVTVCKAIALFDAGLRAEAFRHVEDLVAHSPDVEDPCGFVRAKMHATLASEAKDNADSINALTQARRHCPSGQCLEMDAISLISGWSFDSLRLTIYQQSCKVYGTAGHTHEVLGILREMETIFKDDIKLKPELKKWLADVKSQCVEILERQGDKATENNDYENAIVQYSEALAVNPAIQLKAALFVKRSKARIAACQWGGALNDADEAVRSDSSSPWGYERRYVALHKLERYEEAIDAVKTMNSVLENSPDDRVQNLRSKYNNPSHIEDAILKVIADSSHEYPIRLINTANGEICDEDERRKIFKDDPIFKELVSSMTTQLHQERIKTVTTKYFEYVMLSHRWEGKELELADVLGKSIYKIDASKSSSIKKLRNFCVMARGDKFRWVWSDTCCIKKDNNVELGKSIISMFHWYRRSAATFVYLSDVPPGTIDGIKESVWMKRGWTLQELIAPPVIRFYYNDWSLYTTNTTTHNMGYVNHKECATIMEELKEVTDILACDSTFNPGPENVRAKFRLASSRKTKELEDMAYSLVGIFGISMDVRYGEGQQHALGRLFEMIVARSRGDIGCLAWVGRSSECNSAFPDHIRVYQHASRTVPHLGEEDMEKQVVDLQREWTHEEEEQIMVFYDRLSKSPSARCIHQCIHLPCIAFPLATLEEVAWTDKVCTYHATASALEDTEICTEETFQNQNAQEFVLVCPWIHELLGSTPPGHSHHRFHRHQSGDSESPSDGDSKLARSEPELERDVSVRARTPGPRSATYPSVSLPSSTHTPDAKLKASRLVVRFRQPLGALLLHAQGRGQYRRVATDHDIVMRVRKGVSLGDMALRLWTLEIL